MHLPKWSNWKSSTTITHEKEPIIITVHSSFQNMISVLSIDKIQWLANIRCLQWMTFITITLVQTKLSSRLKMKQQNIKLKHRWKHECLMIMVKSAAIKLFPVSRLPLCFLTKSMSLSFSFVFNFLCNIQEGTTSL